jgi:hypothetical protein
MWIKKFTDLEYRPGYVASGWVTYEDDLLSYLDVYDYDWSCTSIEGNFRCPLDLERQAEYIVNALLEEGYDDAELF